MIILSKLYIRFIICLENCIHRDLINKTKPILAMFYAKKLDAMWGAYSHLRNFDNIFSYWHGCIQTSLLYQTNIQTSCLDFGVVKISV